MSKRKRSVYRKWTSGTSDAHLLRVDPDNKMVEIMVSKDNKEERINIYTTTNFDPQNMLHFREVARKKEWTDMTKHIRNLLKPLTNTRA